MKKIILAVSLLTPFAASSQDAPTVTGKWTIHNSIMGNESDHVCTITAKDADITGTCDGGGVLTGKLDGKTITWEIKSKYNDAPITLDYKGKINGSGNVTGTVTVVEYNVDGDYTAKMVK